MWPVVRHGSWSRAACEVIGKRLGLNPNQVRQALVAWFQPRGVPVPDNRARRNARPAPDGWRPKYQAIADDVKRLLDEGLLIEDIATPTEFAAAVRRRSERPVYGDLSSSASRAWVTCRPRSRSFSRSVCR